MWLLCATFNRNAKRVRGAHILYNMEWWQQFNLKTKYAVNNKMSTGEVTFSLININYIFTKHQQQLNLLILMMCCQ